MEVRRYLSIVRRRALLILAIIAASLAAGYLVTPKTKTYTATSTLYVGPTQIDPDPRAGQVNAGYSQGVDRFVTTFLTLLKSPRVARAAIEETGVERTTTQVAGSISAVQPPFTNLISLSVTDADPATARALANGVGRAFEEIAAEDLQADDVTAELVTFFEPAALPRVANPTDLLRNLGLSLLFGIIVAGGLVALLEHLDISIRSNDDIERHLELTVLGVIPALGERLPTPPPARVEGLEQVQQAGPRGAPVG
jgi:capsular polysaccharide biosynthesis protein